jgi:hypothetical protein
MESFQETYPEGLIPFSHYHTLDEGDDHIQVFARLAKASNNASPMKANFAEGHYHYDPNSSKS